MKKILVLLLLALPLLGAAPAAKSKSKPAQALAAILETLRYSVDIPAQALAYKMGSSRIWELRRHAEKELGAKLDLRRFHDAVLGSGALPMAVLTKQIDGWIEQERRR